MEFVYSIVATLLVSSVSFIGIIVLLQRIRKKSYIITALISFAAGSLLGDVFFHLIPEQIISEEPFLTNETILGILFGIILMLIVEAYFHCSHDSSEELENHEKHSHLAKLNLIGDGLHNFLDGLAIASSFLVSPSVGIATTIAVIMHEIPQELADVSILSYSGWSRVKILLSNFATALTSLLGVLVTFVLNSFIEHAEAILVPIAAGQFIYIALADLIPEIHKKSGVKKYILEISTFVVGIAVMYLLTLVE